MDPNTPNQPIAPTPQESPIEVTSTPTPEQSPSGGKSMALMGTLITVFVLVLVAGGGWYMLSMKKTNPSPAQTVSPQVTTPTAGASATITPEISSDTLPDIGTSEEINTEFNEVNTDLSQL